jgi:cytochrome P450
VNLCKDFNAVTNDVIGSTAFGQSFNSVSLPDRHPLVRHTAAVLEGIIYYILIPPSYKYWRWFPVAKSIDFVRTFVSDVIRQRKDLIKEKGIDAAPQDILQNLVMAEDAESGTRLNEEEVLSESLTLLVAGADTTSHTLSWTCYLLARNPQYIPLLLAELATVTLENNRFSHNQLKNLPLLNAIISEGLRLFPVAGTALLRKVGPNGFVVPFNGSDVVLAEGTELVIPIWTLHRSPAIWQRAEEFWPERWFVDDLSAPVKKTEAAAGPGVCRRDSFFPFSEGSRDCIGKVGLSSLN